MKQYLDLLAHVLEHGTDRGDRTGTHGVFSYQIGDDLSQGFPKLSCRHYQRSADIFPGVLRLAAMKIGAIIHRWWQTDARLTSSMAPVPSY